MGIQKREGPVAKYYWSPASMMDEMDKMISDMRQLSSDWMPRLSEGARVPAVDVREEADRYQVEAEMPGVTKEEISIDVGDGLLAISAKRGAAKEENKDGYLRHERGPMNFFRRLGLPDDVDLDGITAKLEDGVLRVNLPKKMASPEKKTGVTVQ